MKIGIACAPTAYSADMAVLAAHCEKLGFESLWTVDHPVIPAQWSTPFPGSGSMPDYYHDLLDPFIALAAAAGATETLRLGTAITLVPEREPLVMAKEVATLDLVSNGRFEFGIGAGWLKEEGEIFKVDWPRRWTQTREFILAMKQCWTQEIAEFQGDYISFPPLYSEPKPVQQPHPPILIAGELAKAASRVADYADGWLPRYSRISLDGIAEGRKTITDLYQQQSRDISNFAITLFDCPAEPEAIQQADSAGVDRILIRLAPVAEQQSLRQLDNWAKTLLMA